MAGPTVPNQALLNGINPLAYMGVRPSAPSQFLVVTRNPTLNDKNYPLGTWWLNNNTPYPLYILVNLAQGVATWLPISTSVVGSVETLTSNTGGAVPPLAGNINVVGDGVTITGVGNPATNTITLSLIGGQAAVDSLTGNSGGAVFPAANGNINVVGDPTNNITVVGNPGANTLTASVTGTTNHSLLLGNAAGSISSLGVAANGQLPIGSVGADPVLATLTAGTGVTIVNGAGSITISAAGTDTYNYVNVTTSPYVVQPTDQYLSVNTAIAITVQLPNAPATGKTFIIKDRTGGAAANNITVTTVGGVVTIDGSTSFAMNTAFESISLIFGVSGYEVW